MTILACSLRSGLIYKTVKLYWMKSAVVIPVYNEGERVLAPIRAAQGFSHIDEVIVVDDGSIDDTAEVLGAADGITVLAHRTNQGKGEALDTGMQHVQAAGYEAAVFLDGDLAGIEPHHVKELLAPLDDKAHMTIGYLGLRKAFIKKTILSQWGALSGQRALRVGVWDYLSSQDRHRFNVEAALNARLRKNNLHNTISRVALDGVSHTGKRQKEGNWPQALWGYAKTYSSAALTYARIELEDILD